MFGGWLRPSHSARSSVKLSECSLTARETSNVLRRAEGQEQEMSIPEMGKIEPTYLLTDCLVVQECNDPLHQVARSTALRPNGTEN